MEPTVSTTSAGLSWRTCMHGLPGLLLLIVGLAFVDAGNLLLWGLQAGAVAFPTVLLLIVLYVAPGLAVLRFFWPRRWLLSAAAYLGLALGISTALPPLLLLCCAQFGIPWNTGMTWGYLLISVLLLVWPARPGDTVSRKWHLPTYNDLSRHWPRASLDETGIALIAIGVTALLIRLYVVRDLPTGLFGDAYHHTIIAQLLIDNQGLFQSWQPYVPLATFTYHFGFHANAAFVHWTTGLEAIQSVLWSGQIINTLSVVLAYVLVSAAGGDSKAGVWAVIITGFVLTLPGFLVNWGRYTSLMGQVVLVPVVVCWIGWAEYTAQQVNTLARPPQREWRTYLYQITGAIAGTWRLLLLAVLLTVAIILTHYRITVFAAVFVGSYLVVLILAKRSGTLLLVLCLQAVVAIVLVLLLASPWLLRLVEGYLLRNASAIVSGGIEASRIEQVASLPAVQPFYLTQSVIGAALIGLLIAGWQRHWRVALFGGWCALLVLCVVPHVIGLPGTGIIDHLTALGALYVPAAPLAGYAVSYVHTGAAQLLTYGRVPASIQHALASLAGAAIILWGADEQAHILHGRTQLVTNADMDAMQWVREQTDPSASFLVNSFPAYGGTLVAGTDAGWWLAFLTGRATNQPPITYGSELGEDPAYMQHINNFAATIRGRPLSDPSPIRIDLTRPDTLQALRDAQIDYIYSGAHAAPGHERADYIDTEVLRHSPAFQLVYDQGGVEIFRLVDGSAQ